MVLVYGRAGRLTAKNTGFWPGQTPKLTLPAALRPYRALLKRLLKLKDAGAIPIGCSGSNVC